jgi:ribonuclease J
LEVWPVHVDHSIPGAYGFVAVTGEGPVVYSGDLRFHGPASRLSQEFVRVAAMARPKALLLEGTRVNLNRRDSEEDVFSRSVDLSNKTADWWW